jgi:transmembrane sensor
VVAIAVGWRGSVGRGTAGSGGALHLASGEAIASGIAVYRSPGNVAFDDGSRIAIDPGARLEPLDNGARAFGVLLASGRATFDVKPGGPRRWTIECGLFTVEVLGTKFTIERAPHRARIDVERGIVLVRGDHVRDGAQKLTAGQSIEVEEPPRNIDRNRAPEREDASAVVATALTPPIAAPVTALPPPPAAQGSPSVPSSASVDDLLAAADLARQSGHPGDAVAPLSRVVREHAGDPRAALAAFTLGRLQLDALSQPAVADDTFGRAIALGLPRSLEADAYARRVEARARAGDAIGAREAASDYQRRFPTGERLDEVRRWARGD